MGESKLQLNIERKTKNFGGKGCYPKFFCVAMHPKEAAGGRCCRYFTKYFENVFFLRHFATLLQRFVWYNSPIFEKRGGIGYAGTEYPDEYSAEKEMKERYLK